MTTVRVVLLRCDECGEIFDTGARTVRAALAGARHDGWERHLNEAEHRYDDHCGICLGKFWRSGMGYLHPVKELRKEAS